ncbi:MAG: anthranilate synthase component I family protein [Nitrospirales bacterium]
MWGQPTYTPGENGSTIRSSPIFPLIRHCPIAVADAFDLYDRLTGCSPHSFFLEHDDVHAGVSRRYAYIGNAPSVVITGKGGLTTVWSPGAESQELRPPLHYLSELFSAKPFQGTQKILPFQGGMVGCLSYDLARSLESLPEIARDDLNFPDVYALLVETFVVVDQASPGVWLVFSPSPQRVAGEHWDRLYREGRAKLAELEARLTDPGLTTTERTPHAFSPRIVGEQSAGEYQDRVRACQELIAAGDIYQANISHRFRIEGLTSCFPSAAQAGAALFRDIRRNNPSPHSTFLVLGSDVVVCNSPERLVRLTDGLVDMRPIAGTRPRGESVIHDRQFAEELVSNPKERAEHLMLVDLARNDLGRVCGYGTVRVDEFMTVERYSHVMHLVSNVSGQIKEDVSSWDVIRAVFPGGTISGVPKVHCMELIERLEPVRRGLYTGSIGYIGWNGNMDWNIVIRSLLLREDIGYLQVGAGIVADSVPEREYEETIHKAQAFFRVLGSGSSGKGC